MNNGWPQVPLGELIRHRKEFIEIDDATIYKRCRVQLHAQGIVLRDQVSGVEIKTKRQQVCRVGEFLVAEIDAKLGGYGIVPDDLDGSIVSSHYFLFGINTDKVNRTFLDYFARTNWFAEQVTAQGSTNYAAIRPSHVLAYKIPLPPLEEQQKIVARLKALAAKIAEARRLSDDTVVEVEQLCRSLIFGKMDRCTPTPMRELVKRRPLDVEVRPDETYQFAGVYCFGRGVFRSKRISGNEFAYRQLTKLRKDDFIYPKLMAWEGALATVPKECDGCVVSPEFPVFAPNLSRVLPETLDLYFRTPAVWPALSGASTGTNVRRKRLNPADFLAYRIPLPPMSVQRQLRNVRRRADEMRQVQTAAALELNALLPSILDRAFKGEL